jgi:hypothetical protein
MGGACPGFTQIFRVQSVVSVAAFNPEDADEE